MFTATELSIAFPNQICLELSDRILDSAWTSAINHSNDAARWNAYLNHLCLSTLLSEFQEEFGLVVAPSTDRANLLSIWEFVNGTAISLGEKRAVIIPADNADTEELIVPQEWVDISTWAASYYIAVQVNPDDGWLRVWGYATHEQLKHKGSYNSLSRTYSLDREDVITDLSILQVSLELSTDERVAIAPLSVLSETVATNILDRIGQPTPYSPRLDLPFVQWGALLENQSWRHRLYSQRIGQASTQVITNLSQWLQSSFDQGWQSIESLFTTELEFRFRSIATDTAIQRGKQIDFGMLLAGNPIALIVTILPEIEAKIGVILQIYPIGIQDHLPAGLQLLVLDETGNVFRESLPSRSIDSQLRLQFTGSLGARFAAKVVLGNTSVIENFTIDPS